jgi:hypothetical protein
MSNYFCFTCYTENYKYSNNSDLVTLNAVLYDHNKQELCTISTSTEKIFNDSLNEFVKDLLLKFIHLNIMSEEKSNIYYEYNIIPKRNLFSFIEVEPEFCELSFQRAFSDGQVELLNAEILKLTTSSPGNKFNTFDELKQKLKS